MPGWVITSKQGGYYWNNTPGWGWDKLPLATVYETCAGSTHGGTWMPLDEALALDDCVMECYLDALACREDRDGYWAVEPQPWMACS